jgi:hypothetical protein
MNLVWWWFILVILWFWLMVFLGMSCGDFFGIRLVKWFVVVKECVKYDGEYTCLVNIGFICWFGVSLVLIWLFGVYVCDL